jgi:hypothetical protein
MGDTQHVGQDRLGGRYGTEPQDAVVSRTYWHGLCISQKLHAGTFSMRPIKHFSCCSVLQQGNPQAMQSSQETIEVAKRLGEEAAREGELGMQMQLKQQVDWGFTGPPTSLDLLTASFIAA